MRAIEAARACALIDAVLVSTDDEEIARVSQEAGALVPSLRPADLARDTTPEWRVWQHVLREWERREGALPDMLVALSPTAPLRTPQDVEACIRELEAQPEADIVITVTPAARNPYFSMVTLADGWASIAIPGRGPVHRRQDAPAVYDITPVAYATRPRFVLEVEHYTQGRMRAVVVPPERAVDVDTPLDLAFAEFLHERGRQGGVAGAAPSSAPRKAR